jgi:hypothetical protein
MQGRMPGNVMGTPHSNHNYPQNPNNNARQGGGGSGGGQSNNPRTGDKLSITSEKGLPQTGPSLLNSGLGAGRIMGAPVVPRPMIRRGR